MQVLIYHAALAINVSMALTQALSKMLFALSPTDPPTLGGVAAVLLLIALLASWLPAQRVKRIDPMTALREE